MCSYFCADPNYPVCPLREVNYPSEGHWRKALAEREKTERMKATALPAADFDEPPTTPGYIAGQRCAHRWESTLGPHGFSIKWHCAICGAKPEGTGVSP